MAAADVDVMMVDFTNGRKRGRSPPDMDDECAPISKRIAGLSLDHSNNHARPVPHPAEVLSDNRQAQQYHAISNPENGYPPLQHLQIRNGNTYSHAQGSHQESHLQHQIGHQQSSSYAQESHSHPFQEQHGMQQQHQNSVSNQSLPQNSPYATIYPYNPNIESSAHFRQNEVLYHCYLERTQRHGRNLHPSFYERQ